MLFRYPRLRLLELLPELRLERPDEDDPRELEPDERTDGRLPDERTEGLLLLELGRFTVLRLGAVRFGALYPELELPLERLSRTRLLSYERRVLLGSDERVEGRVTVVRLRVLRSGVYVRRVPDVWGRLSYRSRSVPDRDPSASFRGDCW